MSDDPPAFMSGYSQSVLIKDARPMSERWKPRRGLRHRMLMLWPRYRRREKAREWLRYIYSVSR